MNKSSFFIVGKHPVIEALKNKRRKVLRVFLTEESKKTIHRENQKKNLLDNIKVYFMAPMMIKIQLYLYSTHNYMLFYLQLFDQLLAHMNKYCSLKTY